MTAIALKGRTEWEARQFAADHGKSAAIALGYHLLARFIHDNAVEDMELLGITRPAGPRPYMQPVTGPTYEERKAKVDRWAARHGVAASFDDESGQYRAVLSFGPCSYVVYTVTEGRLKERVEALHRAVAEREAAA